MWKFGVVVLLAVTLSSAQGKSVAQNVSFREARSYTGNYLDILKCAGQLDFSCALDKAEDVLIESHKRFLVEADHEAMTMGRKISEEESPSSLIESISSIFSKISQLVFKNGINGFFRDGKESSDDDDDEDEEEKDIKSADEKDKEVTRRLYKRESVAVTEEPTKQAQNVDEKKHEDAIGRVYNGEARKKKKIKKLIAIIKLLVLGVVLFGKITLLLKILAAHLQIKFLIIAAAGLLINAARFYLDLKKGHSPQKVIYYEHAQHQHHYDGGEEDWTTGGGGGGGGSGGYWSRRSYELEDDKKTAQDLAYANQKPKGIAYSKVEDTPNFSWL